MNLPPQIGITWARLTDALRRGLEPGTVALGHRLDAVETATDADAAADDAAVLLRFAAPRAGGEAPRRVESGTASSARTGATPASARSR